MTASRLELSAAGRRFGRRVALENVSLTLRPGERVAMIGPSGAGKSTLLALLMGALRTTSGAVRVDGVDLAAMPPQALQRHRRRCALVDQSSLVIPGLNVHRNVLAGRLPRLPWWTVAASLAWPLERARVRALLREVGLAERQWDPATTLSGGQRQRVAIARALAAEPALMLADEPTAALDRATAREVIESLTGAASRRNATLVISTHRVSEVLGAVDRVIGLRGGRVAFDVEPKRLDEAALDTIYEGSRELA